MLSGRLFIPVWVCGITMGIASAQDARVLTVENIVQSSTGEAGSPQGQASRWQSVTE